MSHRCDLRAATGGLIAFSEYVSGLLRLSVVFVPNSKIAASKISSVKINCSLSILIVKPIRLTLLILEFQNFIIKRRIN